MKLGCLVKRKSIWAEWQKYNPYIREEKTREIGLIVACGRSLDFRVLWPSGGLRWHDKDDLEIINENR